MNIVSLSDICDLQNGFAFKSHDYIEHSSTLNCRMSNIRPGGNFDIEYNPKYLPDSYTQKYKDFLLKDGDIVIAMTDMANDPKILGVPTIVDTKGYDLLLNQRVGKLIFHKKDEVDVRFLQYSLNRKSVRKYYTQFAGGGLQLNVGKKEILSVKIPLPSLPQQQKIANILDAADALRQNDKALIAKYDELTQSLFLDMFGDPVSNPKGWEKVETIKYCDSIVPGRDKPKSFTGTTPWVTTNDLNYLGKTSSSKSNIGLTDNEILQVKAKIIPEGSVIMTCVGDLGVVTVNTSKMVVNQQLHAFICGPKLKNDFLMYSLSFQKPYMYKMSSSTTVPYMNKTVCNNTPTIVPPIELQNQFAERVAVIEEQKAIAQNSLAKSEELFNSLLQKAFKGEL